jgi:hypothetical protein
VRCGLILLLGSAMSRSFNVFHKLVTNEDTLTELLCNLMQFSVFRRAVVARLLEERCAATIEYADIDTQIVFRDYGRPDLVIDNDDVYAFVEVKIVLDRPLTENQLDAYLNRLSKDGRRDRWLVFLVPRKWIYVQDLQRSIQSACVAYASNGVRAKIVYWEDILDLIEKEDLRDLSPYFDAFGNLLAERLKQRPIMFVTGEVFMLFRTEVPEALSKLKRLVDSVKEKSGAYDPSLTCTKDLPPEYALYFRDSNQNDVLWFGVWPEFWRQEGFPLSFGVRDKWSQSVQDAFRASCKGRSKRFEGWSLDWIGQEVLEATDPSEMVWQRLEPVLQAVLRAAKEEPPA